MTPSQYIRSKGLPSLVHVANKVKKDPRTLYKWYHNNFALFEIVVKGCVAEMLADRFYPPSPIATIFTCRTPYDDVKRGDAVRLTSVHSMIC